MTPTTRNDAPLYIRFRELAEGEIVARTVDYDNLGQVMIDLDAKNEIIGVEILSYLCVEVDAVKVFDMKNVVGLLNALRGLGKQLPGVTDKEKNE